MATAKQIGEPRFGPLADLGRKYAAAERALIRQVLAEWEIVLRQKLKPGELRPIGEYMRDHPYAIGAHYGPYIYLILQNWLKNTKAPSRPRIGKGIAQLVDTIVKAEGIRPNAAYHKVADALDMEFDTVSVTTRGTEARSATRRAEQKGQFFLSSVPITVSFSVICRRSLSIAR